MSTCVIVRPCSAVFRLAASHKRSEQRKVLVGVFGALGMANLSVNTLRPSDYVITP
jgi:hypothetical protein